MHANTAPTRKGTHILVVGDSLSAEYGLARGSGWVALLANKMEAEQRNASVTNASVSGDTTAGGRARLPSLLAREQPNIVIIELGGNDALRGLPLRATEDNLRAMIQAARNAGAQVLLLGMQMPPNYGTRYAQEFEQLYAAVSANAQATLLPFFLKNVADVAHATSLFQSDCIHPNAKAQPLLLANVWSALQPMLPKSTVHKD